VPVTILFQEKIMKTIAILSAMMLTFVQTTVPQSESFDVEAYKTFLAGHQNLSSSQLMDLHSAGTFGDR